MLQWQKMRITDEIRRQVNWATEEFNSAFGLRFHVITQPFSKIIGCRSGDLFFFHIGDGGRPSIILTLAILINSPPKALFPMHRDSDFDVCCSILNITDQVNRDLFHDFLVLGLRKNVKKEC